MAGHSKWKNILHKKGKTDAQRGQVFTRIGREIAVTVREGGPDPASNSRLRDVIAKAKANNVPNDNITRMIQKAAGGDDQAAYESITYEGYGPAGVAVIVQTLTDNRNRTAAEMRHYFDKYGGNLGAQNCVSWQFDSKGSIVIAREGLDEDSLMMAALEAGADDVAADENGFEITCAPAAFSALREALESAGYAFAEAEIGMFPSTYVALTAEEDIKNMNKLIDMLEDNDDVQNIWHNWDE